MEGLKPYAAYKESGLPWMGQVPAHWRVQRLKTVLQEVDHRSPDGSETLLSLSRSRGLIRRRAMTEKVHSAKTLVGYKQYRPGQIVMNRMQAWSGLFGAGDEAGLVSPDYAVFDVGATENVKLILERLKSPDMVAQFALESTGIGSGFNRLYSDRLGAIPVSLAPANEQAAIVRFLDHSMHRLDKAMRAKRKIIALLNEQKQAIIHRAVTCGLDPDVPLKDSGIPWLGRIPAHWGILRAKYLFCEVDERSRTGNEELLSVSHLTGVTPRSEKNITMFKAETYAGHKVCRSGDLVINTMWAWMAALGVSKHTGIISPAYAVYRQRKPGQLANEYVDSLLRTKPYVSNYICRSAGVRASRMRLYPEEFFRIPIIIPPIAEQKAIISELRVETREIVAAIERIDREISLLREYRTRLIADVVTGKLDVREAAARLPEIAPEAAEELDSIEAEEALDDLVEEAA